MTKPLILALLFLSAPALAGGKTDIPKTSQACDTVPVRLVEVEPDVIVINYLLAQAHTRAWVKAERARRLAVPCEAPRRIRSPKDLRCYLKSRLP